MRVAAAVEHARRLSRGARPNPSLRPPRVLENFFDLRPRSRRPAAGVGHPGTALPFLVTEKRPDRAVSIGFFL